MKKMKQHLPLLLALAAALALTLPFASCEDETPDATPPPQPPDEQIDYVYKQTRSPKRGVSFNTIYPADFDVLKTGVSWFWNWGVSFNNTLESAFAAAGIDYCPMAWNGNYNANAIRSYVEMFRKYGKPVWMTEFCAWEGTVSDDRQREYMSDVINYMESEPLIERYSWFKYDGNPAGNPHYALRPTGNNRGELTDLGKIYLSISSLDKTTAYAPDEIVPAEHYSNTNMSDVAGTSGWAPGVQLKICSDPAGGILEVANFGLPKWLEYRLDLSTPPNLCQIAIRYAAIVDSKCRITIDGKDTEIELPATASATDWRTLRHSLELPDGSDSVYTIRFTPTKGLLSLNWWRIETENNE